MDKFHFNPIALTKELREYFLNIEKNVQTCYNNFGIKNLRGII